MLADTYWLKEKYPYFFLDADLETIKIEGEVAKVTAFWGNERAKEVSMPKRWMRTEKDCLQGKIELILELADNSSVNHFWIKMYFSNYVIYYPVHIFLEKFILIALP